MDISCGCVRSGAGKSQRRRYSQCIGSICGAQVRLPTCFVVYLTRSRSRQCDQFAQHVVDALLTHRIAVTREVAVVARTEIAPAASVGSSVGLRAKAKHTIPTGLATLPPVGPATPVTE